VRYRQMEANPSRAKEGDLPKDLELERRLAARQAVRFGDRAEAPPSLKVVPKRRGPVAGDADRTLTMAEQLLRARQHRAGAAGAAPAAGADDSAARLEAQRLAAAREHVRAA